MFYISTLYTVQVVHSGSFQTRALNNCDSSLFVAGNLWRYWTNKDRTARSAGTARQFRPPRIIRRSGKHSRIFIFINQIFVFSPLSSKEMQCQSDLVLSYDRTIVCSYERYFLGSLCHPTRVNQYGSSILNFILFITNPVTSVENVSFMWHFIVWNWTKKHGTQKFFLKPGLLKMLTGRTRRFRCTGSFRSARPARRSRVPRTAGSARRRRHQRGSRYII